MRQFGFARHSMGALALMLGLQLANVQSTFGTILGSVRDPDGVGNYERNLCVS